MAEKVKTSTIIMAIICTLALLVAMMQCSRHGAGTFTVRDRIIHDTVRLPSTHIEADSSRTTYHVAGRGLNSPRTIDSALLATVIRQRDSLRGLLVGMHVSEMLELDTITDRGDSINVVCNETLRSILLSIRPKPITRDIIIRDTTPVEIRNAGWALTLTAGVGIGVDLRPGPVVAIGISRTIIPLTFLGD